MESTFDVRDFSRAEDPHCVLDELRSAAPVHWDPGSNAWFLTRYADVMFSLRDPRFSADRISPFFDRLDDQERAKLATMANLLPLWVVFRDAEPHLRLRTLMRPMFLPAAVRPIEPKVETVTDRLINAWGDAETVEFVDQFAVPFPGMVILDLLGIPHEDLETVRPWNDDLALFIGTARETPEKHTRAEQAMRNLADYFREFVKHKRNRPGDDAITRLITARDQDDALTEDEVVAACILLIFAGYETTTNLLGNSMIALARNPDQHRALRTDPELASSAVEEFLRFDGPVKAVSRIVIEDLELDGQQLRAGDRVFPLIIAANHDPQRFDRPHELDLARTNNRHLTFGWGEHFCLGASLARIEGRVALPRIARRFPEIELADEPLSWRDGILTRGVTSLPLNVTAAAG